MSYMEQKMQDQIDGAIHLEKAICDDACEIFKQTGTMPLDMKKQRDELLEILQGVLKMDRGTSGRIIIEGWQEKVIMATIAQVTGMP